MQTDNLELKKLVYLYLMNYAKSQPDMAIMAVNSFVKARPQITFILLEAAVISLTLEKETRLNKAPNANEVPDQKMTRNVSCDIQWLKGTRREKVIKF